MTFFKELRRRSKASFRTSDSSNESHGTVPTTKSSSTLNSALGGSTTPPSTHHANGSSGNLPSSKPNADSTIPPLPQRPAVTTYSNRNSMITLSPSGSTPTMRVPQPTSPYAPKLSSILDGSVVYQKVLLIQGDIGEPKQKAIDGTLTVHHDKDGLSFPPTHWPVSESSFKALVYLSPGWNRIRFDFNSPKLSNSSNSTAPMHSSFIMLNYLPLNSAPPLHLAILVGRDSPCTYDTMPDRREREGNDLSLAIRKFRMAAHLWQAFTAEQMYRNKFGRRCFRFDEEWQTGTLSIRDWEGGQMKNEAKVHVIRAEQTVEELRDLNRAQQHSAAENKGDLYSISADAIKKYFNMRDGQRLYVACLILDSHWDREANTILAHAALGGCSDSLSLGIFGSHALQSYPSCIEEVVPSFMDCTVTDTLYVANDCDESGSSWEAANIGIGAHLHEVGHLFGSPHQETGVMLRDYVRLNRSFVISEPYSTRTQSPGMKVCRTEDECGWHRLDALRFRYHPCFRLPSDETASSQDESTQIFPVDNGRIICCAASGVSFVEIHTEGDDLCGQWIEFTPNDPRTNSIPRQITLTESDIRARLPENKRKRKIKLEVFSGGSGRDTIEDMDELLSKKNTVSLPPIRQAPRQDEGLTMNAFNGVVGLGKSFESRLGFKSKKLGASNMDGTKEHMVILESATFQTKLLTSVRVYSGLALDGVEFCYEDGKTQLFGQRGGKPGGDEFFLDTRRGETILGFYLRAGAWIDGIQILTSTGRRSGIYGNPNGGSGHTLMAPRGYFLAGIAGTCGSWIDGFQIIITR